ncbi:Alpha/Beta hydrolase protein [Xylariales sp. PMI_506]|nr:Alpha/Beta hydrolase protein [Xylariales sp. PMI_506]
MAPAFELSPDESFNFEVLRALGLTRYAGADVGEVLQAAASLKPGDFESFHDAFYKIAVRVRSQADLIDASRHPVSARDAYFRAATYLRSADFFLHGRADDPRIVSLWDQQMASFDKAIALLPIPGQRLLLKSAAGFDVPAIYYRAGDQEAAGAETTATKARPTIILGNGFDGAHEEMLHTFGFAALERGYNVITYEGPGQPTVRRKQGLGFIADWEKVVSPVVDYLTARPEVDSCRIALLGWSLGGFFAVRGAAFDPRLAAAIAVDGVHTVSSAFLHMLPPDAQASYKAGDAVTFDAIVRSALESGKAPTTARWGIEHGLWSFAVDSPAEFVKRIESMTIGGFADRVKCPVLLCEASDDMFFAGEPARAKEALGDLATHVVLTVEDAANLHCHMGAMTVACQTVFDWLDGVFLTK